MPVFPRARGPFQESLDVLNEEPKLRPAQLCESFHDSRVARTHAAIPFHQDSAEVQEGLKDKFLVKVFGDHVGFDGVPGPG